MSVVIRRAIYGKLAGDTTLTNLLHSPPAGFSQSIYHQIAPEGALFPFVIFAKQSGTPRYALGAKAFDDELWLVKGVDRSTDEDPIDSISSRLDALLTDGALSISGKTQLYLRRDSDVDYSEVPSGSGERVIHSGSLYRLVYQ